MLLNRKEKRALNWITSHLNEARTIDEILDEMGDAFLIAISTLRKYLRKFENDLAVIQKEREGRSYKYKLV